MAHPACMQVMDVDGFPPTMTLGRVREVLKAAIVTDDVSRVNPSLTKRAAFEILSKAIAQYESRPDGERLDGSMGPMIAKNIAREFGRDWLSARDTGGDDDAECQDCPSIGACDNTGTCAHDETDEGEGPGDIDDAEG